MTARQTDEEQEQEQEQRRRGPSAGPQFIINHVDTCKWANAFQNYRIRVASKERLNSAEWTGQLIDLPGSTSAAAAIWCSGSLPDGARRSAAHMLKMAPSDTRWPDAQRVYFTLRSYLSDWRDAIARAHHSEPKQTADEHWKTTLLYKVTQFQAPGRANGVGVMYQEMLKRLATVSPKRPLPPKEATDLLQTKQGLNALLTRVLTVVRAPEPDAVVVSTGLKRKRDDSDDNDDEEEEANALALLEKALDAEHVLRVEAEKTAEERQVRVEALQYEKWSLQGHLQVAQLNEQPRPNVNATQIAMNSMRHTLEQQKRRLVA